MSKPTKQREQEIRRMLEYIAKHDDFGCIRHDERTDAFYVSGLFDEVLASDGKKRDHTTFIILFNVKSLSIYTYDESHHNGDAYNTEKFAVDWNHILTGYDRLKEQVRELALAEAEKKIKKKMGDKQLAKILKGELR
jgi:uncharacterized protein YutD